MPAKRVLALLDFSARGEAVLRHATGLAVKNRSSLIVVHVIDRDPLFESDGPCGRFLPEERLFFTARAATEKLHLFLARNDASWAESTVLYGKTDVALAQLVARWKPDLIVADERAMRHRATARGLGAAATSTQVLTLERVGWKWNAVALPGNPDLRGGEKPGARVRENVASIAQAVRQRPQLMRTALLGAATALLYWLLFANEALVLQLSAKGHWYFVIPVAVAFVFSFVHGAFTAQFWDALGVKARRKH